jgi:formate-dependent nitrite reductase membrane component NrfD
VLPCPPLLIMDLGRPMRFLNMMRIFKPRSPMSMGAWCLVGFSTGTALAVVGDLVLQDKLARRLSWVNALLGGYLGSYTGVLLASTAVPVWARSHLALGPIFVCTGVATGAAACRLALVAAGMPSGHPTREALGRVETGAIATELVLSQVNELHLGSLAHQLESGRAGRWMHAAKWLIRAGITARLATPRGSRTHHVASVSYMAAALCFRYGWVTAGRQSARDDKAVARMARSRLEGQAGK